MKKLQKLQEKEEQMKYKVSVSYIDITFDDGMEALKFADQAKLHADEDTAVKIALINDEEKQA